jgi:hypothetical protein
MKRVKSVTKLNVPNLPFLHALRTWKARFFIEDPYIFSNNIGGESHLLYFEKGLVQKDFPWHPR